MLRINLLPSYVAQRRLTRQMVVLFTLIFIGVVLVMLGIYAPLPGQLAAITTKAANVAAIKTQVDDLHTQAQTATAQIQPIQDKLNFVKACQDYNLSYVNLYSTLAQWTTPKILYSSISCDGKTVSLSAYAPNLGELARYLQVMYGEPDFSAVSVSAIPGYHSSYTPKDNSITLPNLPPGYVARFPGNQTPVKGFTVSSGTITQIQSGLETSQQAAPQANSVSIPYEPTMGFDFTVTAILKKPIAPPSPPAGGGAAAPAGPKAPGPPPGPAGP